MRLAVQRSQLTSEMRIDVLPGQLGGSVTDASGAVIANARMTLTSSANGISRMAVSDASGRWTIARLPSGNYKIKAESTGFRTISRRFTTTRDGLRPTT